MQALLEERRASRRRSRGGEGDETDEQGEGVPRLKRVRVDLLPQQVWESMQTQLEGTCMLKVVSGSFLCLTWLCCKVHELQEEGRLIQFNWTGRNG